MGLDEWELLDCHEDDEQKLCSADEEKSVSPVSGQKLIGDVKKESPRSCSAAESDMQEGIEGMEEGVNSRRMNMAMEKRQKWGKAAICSFGIAVAATICSVLLGNHNQHRGGANKQRQNNQICPCEFFKLQA